MDLGKAEATLVGGEAESVQMSLFRKWGSRKVGGGSEPEDRRGHFLADAGSEKGRK